MPSVLFAEKEQDGVPKAFWVGIYFESINGLTKKVNWTPLRDVDMQAGAWSFELRVWSGFGLTPLDGIRLCRNGDEWTGFYVTEEYFKAQEYRQKHHLLTENQKAFYALYQDAKPLYTLKPKTDWEGLWKKVEALGILTLPDDSTLPNKGLVRDGICYVVEINDGGRYRTYMYDNPQFQKWPEAKKIIKIIETLRDEFLRSLPSRSF